MFICAENDGAHGKPVKTTHKIVTMNDSTSNCNLITDFSSNVTDCNNYYFVIKLRNLGLPNASCEAVVSVLKRFLGPSIL